MNIIPVIMNPHAGKGRGKKALEEITRFFSNHAITLQLHKTEAPKHAIAIAKSLLENGARILFSMGGDGTAYEVINGIMQSGLAQETRLGILPLGTGNSFLRDFQCTSWRQVAEAVLANRTTRVDIGKMSFFEDGEDWEIFFHNIVGVGMIAKGCELRHNRFHFLGKWGYHAAFFAMLPTFSAQTMQITIDGKTETIESQILAICNSKYTGHEMHISPQSCVTDGTMELLYTDKLSPVKILQLFSSLSSGKHLKSPFVHTRTIQSVDVAVQENPLVMVDGELDGYSPFRIQVIQAALEIFV
jgi:diacylglycerol kinase (ATP)